MQPTMIMRQVQRGYRNIDQGDRHIAIPNVVLQQWWERSIKDVFISPIWETYGEWRDVPIETEVD